MWTLDARIEVTPVGRYVASLHKADAQLEALQHPGLYCSDNRVKRIALRNYNAACRMQTEIREELVRFGGQTTEPEIEEECENTCSECGLCSIHKNGPSCFDENCPNRLTLVSPKVCECGAIAMENYFGRMFCQDCIAFMEAQETRRYGTGYED